ncbi:peptidase domain-containing ABC transporter [Candidatus Galacturonibacter soehngenii]|uniref:Peptidase domain-containing ABC transporter n=1 Tax=Candidatus Galacturonatibacter soehngenii TaxID=2307010 RepID=A0A7V7QIX8_9FIRM|nr:peptidase domain-containing ABC transporter [Candidatus Galacturonibacter soehngenii]KAB1435901.1 peptidase domain-containing ABC transporter [Candidatus Galacturonibacter soehngenii]
MRYTYVKQQDATDCAAACLAMICLHYKKETTITRLRDKMGTDLKGTNLIGLSKCADELGFASQAVRVDKEGFLSKYTLPAIANVVTKEGLSHFVVIFKITDKYVVLGDPAKDLIRIEIDEFYKNFTGALLIIKPNERFTSGKLKNEKLFQRYVKLLLPQKKLFVYSIIASILLTALGIVSSLFNKILMDEILPYKLKNTLLMLLLVFALLSVTQIVIGFIRQWMMIYLSQKIDIPLMLGYFEHIYKLPMKFFATRKTGDIITRFSDAFTIKDIFTNIALTLIMDIAMALVTGVILFRMNTELFVIILFMTIVSILLVFIFKQPYKKINEEQMQQSAILNSQIIEGLRAVETVKGNANEETELEGIEREYIKSLRIGLNEGMLSNIQGSISGLISQVGNLILMYFGIMQVINNHTTLGAMMSFMTLSGYFMDPVSRLVGLQLQIQEANISMKRMTEILDYEEEQETEKSGAYQDIETIEGAIEVKKVTFRYGNRKPVLKEISFTIPKGKKVALVGASGSGKSTIAKLLLKYYEPEAGEILIDGVDINEYSNDSLRRAISYVPQSIELFSKSIYDNIRVGKMNSTLDEVKEAAKAADAHDFIRKLPMQYYTYLEEAGNGLSGGEKQRIALARAFLKKNEFYILDESTSNLDFATENIIFDMIYNKFRNKSMLIIAHRLATVKNCDEILVIDQGEVVEQGTHEELLRQEGHYFKLWEMQQGNFVIKEEEKEIAVTEDLAEEDVMSYA